MKQTIYPLYAPEDAEAVRPILDALRNQGLSVREADKPKRGDAVLLFLSEHLKEDSPAAEQFFAVQAKTATLIPVALDGSTPPDLIKSALLARHTIAAERYSPDELAERIASAVAKKSRLPWIIGIAAAVILIAAAVLLIVNANKAKCAADEPVEPTETPAPTEVPRVPEEAGLKPEDLARVHQVFIIGERFYALFGDEEWVKELSIARVDAENYVHRITDEDGVHWLDNDTAEEIAPYRWEDLDFLRYMTNLQFLDVVCMEGKLPDLSGLTKLDYVRILDSRLDDLQGLSGTRIISLDYTGEAMDFSPLNGCERLRYVNMDLTGDGPEDLDSFGPPSLKKLTLSAGSENGVKEASGLKNCTELTEVHFNDLRLHDLSCLANARSLIHLNLNNLPKLESLNGLTEHKELKDVHIDNCLKLSNLNALKGCPGLEYFEAEDFDTSDVSFLSGASSLKTLKLHNTDSIRSLRGLENHTMLNEIECERLLNLTDISALSGCTGLTRVKFSESFDLWDVTPVVKLPRLKMLELYGAGPDNVNYLADIKKENKAYFSFGVSKVADWSGLSAINRYDFLNITDPDGSSLPYIKDAKINKFELWYRGDKGHSRNVPPDYLLFPDVQSELILHCVPTLVELPAYNVTKVTISESEYLTSLDGIQNLKRIKDGKAVDLEIRDCPRLIDWSALEGLSLSSLHLEQLLTLPSFKNLSVNTIRLESIVDLQDLSPLSNLDPKGYYNIELFDIDGVTDLSPLYKLKGHRLSVPAHLSAQANLLKESNNFSEINIEYPESWWRPYEPYVKLLSLDELDTLPSALLAHVQDLNIYGDRIINWDMQDTDTDWDVNPPVFYVTDRETGEREEIPVGTMTDLSRLSVLTGLKNLNIQNQALESLEGVQYLGNLEDLCVEACFDLTDASAAFTMQNLRKLQLTNAPITSIEGVQNLTELEELKIWSTNVDSIEGVQNLQNLWTLEVSHTPTLTDASAAFTLQNLEELRLQYTGVTSLQGVQNLTKLRRADFNGLDLDDLTPLAALPDDCDFSFDFPLMTVEKFMALPENVLDTIEEIAISGNYVHSPWGNWWFETDWGVRKTYIHCDSTGERIPCETGTITDLNDLPVMKNLRNLQINQQPIENLNGLEKQPNMRQFRMQWCPGVTDISLLFTLPQIEDISVRDSNVKSLEGIGALPHLIRADFGGGGVPIHTLSWLEEIDFTYAETPDENGEAPHFDLSIDWWNLKDEEYRYLALVPAFSYLNINGHAASKWMDILKDKKIGGIGVQECNFDNETFKTFIEQHPELTEINMPKNLQLTDISILLTLPNLRNVWISDNMQKARESLGDNFPFRLDIEY